DGVPDRDPGNSEVNDRDRDGSDITPMDQGNGEIDLDLTQRIRKSVVGDDSLSFGAKNIKIITRDGHVTLRGTVNTAAEKDTIYKTAVTHAGVGHVSNQLEVDD
ncbi:MAG TPA: BON domain-containing protein, partial [Polyangiales bacterium]